MPATRPDRVSREADGAASLTAGFIVDVNKSRFLLRSHVSRIALGDRAGCVDRSLARRRSKASVVLHEIQQVARHQYLPFPGRVIVHAKANFNKRWPLHCRATRRDGRVIRATGITAYLEAGGTLENAQLMAAHESPRTTKLYDRTGDEITLDEVERITI
jgi:hypothetical protein